MSLTFDVIIATYNRPHKVTGFCAQIKKCSIQPGKLIVIDSSDETNKSLHEDPDIVYLKSSHKSQPYQRYVGTLMSEADIIVFFDDDLIINDHKLFERIVELFEDHKTMGVGLGIEYHNIITTKLNTTKSSFTGRLKKLLPTKVLKAGLITLFGETAPLPQKTLETMYLPGPNMSFRRNATGDIFDDTLFALFEHRIGMGEDKVLSMRVAKKGKVIYSGEKNYLLHPAEESSYYSNPVNFYAKVYYSRLWLANQYSLLWNTPLLQLKKVLFLFKITTSSLLSQKKRSAFFLALGWIKTFGWNQQGVNYPLTNYKQHALQDLKEHGKSIH